MSKSNNNNNNNNNGDGEHQNYPSNLEFFPISGKGGHCLFRAFAHIIDNDVNLYQKYRDMAASVIENDTEIQKCIVGDIPTYVKKIREGTIWGGQQEIVALAQELGRCVVVYSKDNNYPTLRINDMSGLPQINLLFDRFASSSNSEEDGHYDLLVERKSSNGDTTTNTDTVEDKKEHKDGTTRKGNDSKGDSSENGKAPGDETNRKGNDSKSTSSDKQKTSKEGNNTALAELIVELIDIEQKLKTNKDTIGKNLRTSFLQSELLLNTKMKDIGDNAEFEGIIPIIENGREVITKITRFDSWWNDNDLVLNLIYDVLQHLKPDDVLGDPARNFFRVGQTDPGIFILHCFSRIVYTILSTILLILVFLGKVEGWYAIIIGFTSATFAALQSENDIVSSISQYLAIFTGIFAAAKGIDLSSNYLYPKFEDLTVEILRLAFGKKYSAQAVYQKLFDWNWYSKFAMFLRVKKADIELVQYVQTFFAIVKSSNIVNGLNYTEIVKLQNVLTRMEGVLQDPYNYLTLYELETWENYDRLYDFNKDHVDKVKKIYNRIAPNDSFREYLKELNGNSKTVHDDFLIPSRNESRGAASKK